MNFYKCYITEVENTVNKVTRENDGHHEKQR